MTYHAPLKLANYQRIVKKDDHFVVMQRWGISLAHYNAIKDLVAHGAPYFYYENSFGKKVIEVEVEVDAKAFKEFNKREGWAR